MFIRNERKLDVLLKLDLRSKIGQLRAVPVSLGSGSEKGILATYCADFDVDPYVEMFFYPTDNYKMVLFNQKGNILWRRDFSFSVVPGVWFCPILPFDLDEDGVDEIWYVNNTNTRHPFGLSGYCLERIDALTGTTTGQWTWSCFDKEQSLSKLFRNFIIGGYVHGKPILVTAQGTYENMFHQAWNNDMSKRWERSVGKKDAGARGSHMCPVIDINNDDIDELMWGERCIDLDKGSDVFCPDLDTYHGHSDIVQPVLDDKFEDWYFYTCRETDTNVSPRVAFYDRKGNRMWGEINQGHIDMGWVARIGQDGEKVAMAVKISDKTCGPDGRFHLGMEEFTYNVFTGKRYELPYRVYKSIPVDLDGDGFHELAYGVSGGSGDVIDRGGNLIGNIGGTIAMASKFMDQPGEQILAFYEDGLVRIWGDRNAFDSKISYMRYSNPYYVASQRLTSVGYNLVNLGGL